MLFGLVGVGLFSLFTFLAVLALMRETMQLRGAFDAVRTVVTHPPEPSFVGHQAPTLLVAALSDVKGETGGNFTVTFVSPGCGGCEMFLGDARRAIADGSAHAADFVYVVQEGLKAAFKDGLPGTVVTDRDGQITRACEVRGTPLTFAISDTMEVLACDMSGDFDWALRHLNTPRLRSQKLSNRERNRESLLAGR